MFLKVCSKFGQGTRYLNPVNTTYLIFRLGKATKVEKNCKLQFYILSVQYAIVCNFLPMCCSIKQLPCYVLSWGCVIEMWKPQWKPITSRSCFCHNNFSSKLKQEQFVTSYIMQRCHFLEKQFFSAKVTKLKQSETFFNRKSASWYTKTK